MIHVMVFIALAKIHSNKHASAVIQCGLLYKLSSELCVCDLTRECYVETAWNRILVKAQRVAFLINTKFHVFAHVFKIKYDIMIKLKILIFFFNIVFSSFLIVLVKYMAAIEDGRHY